MGDFVKMDFFGKKYDGGGLLSILAVKLNLTLRIFFLNV